MFSKGRRQIQGMHIHPITANQEQVRHRLIKGVHLRKTGPLHNHKILQAEAVPITTVPAHRAAAALLITVPALQAAALAPTLVRAAQAEAAALTAVPVAQAKAVLITARAAHPAAAAVHTAAAAHQAGAAAPTAAVHRAGAAVVAHVPVVAHLAAALEDHQDQVHQDQDVKLSFKPGSVRDPGFPKNQNLLL